MANPVVIPGDVVTHAVDIFIHIVEVGCIALLTWLVRIGRREFLEAVDHRAAAAAAESIAPVALELSTLTDKFQKHEDLDQSRHDDVMVELRKRARA